MPVPNPDQVPAEDRKRSLDRAMEEVMMDHVMEENRMLKEQLKQIQKEQATAENEDHEAHSWRHSGARDSR